jgi:hypothetical protein
MRFEIRIPISPSDGFFRRIEYLCRSLRACGGITATANVVVSVGGDVEPFDIAGSLSWHDESVTWRWVDRDAFRYDTFHTTGFNRFEVESEAEIVLFADADLIFVAGIDDVLKALEHTPAIAGVMAHAPPSQRNLDWERLFSEARIPPPADAYQYGGWRFLFDDPTQRLAPAYYNFGAVFVPGAWIPALRTVYEREIVFAEEAGLGDFKGQVALTLAVYRLGLRRFVLEPRYNFPNDPRFDAAYPEDLDDVRILHYLRGEIVHRDRDFASAEALSELVLRDDLHGSNEVLRATVRALMP